MENRESGIGNRESGIGNRESQRQRAAPVRRHRHQSETSKSPVVVYSRFPSDASGLRSQTV
ncbi:hypothetical protein C9396_07665 [Xanthomonas vasicola pv. vasculorum]|uniref:Uncharacterized protein n=1 Tax=Xanthomonas vasicola pv. vasculorum TaxID=325776 RepID=A0AAE8JUQ1_XANVA|nr:hypothetical protein C7V42_05610 [Xanthomonas vasicola pv. vasculorum]TWQ34283.1 hypothetical protein FQJ99_16470 [Xanthomonas vasicola]AZM70372.1 hypothetical protein CXP37_05615 [Xanthomonas vasicola pv. vasculorum]PUE68612.1 hypothetical protein C7Y63_17955 [Xanthomonas vasicola pv. vasculorum]PUE72645.1 hypothetical protein C7Y61_17915 [Xanthomonas vasicola pv. vasculorum]